MYAFTQIRELPDIDLDFLQLQQREHIGDKYHILVRLQQAFTKPESFVEVFQIDANIKIINILIMQLLQIPIHIFLLIY